MNFLLISSDISLFYRRFLSKQRIFCPVCMDFETTSRSGLKLSLIWYPWTAIWFEIGGLKMFHNFNISSDFLGFPTLSCIKNITNCMSEVNNSVWLVDPAIHVLIWYYLILSNISVCQNYSNNSYSFEVWNYFAIPCCFELIRTPWSLYVVNHLP